MAVWSPGTALLCTALAPLAAASVLRVVHRVRKCLRLRSLRRRSASPGPAAVATWNPAYAKEAGHDAASSAVGPAGQADLAIQAGDEPVPRLEKGVRGWHALARLRYLLARRVAGTQMSGMQGIVLASTGGAAVFWASIWPETTTAKAWGSVASGLLLLCVVPGTRSSLVTWFLFTPLDRAIVYHRWLGWMVLAATAVHAGFKLAEDKPCGDMPGGCRRYTYGLLCLASMGAIGLGSLSVVRRRFYNAFRLLHAAYVPFVVFAALHAPQCVPFIVAIAVLVGSDLLLRQALGLCPQRPLAMEALPDGVTRVRLVRSRFKTYRAGQFIFVNFPTMSAMWHPFTLSSGPHEDALQLHIKALGDHTAALHARAVQLAPDQRPPLLRVDGPYGGICFDYARYATILLVAGGVSATPSVAVLRDLFQLGMSAAARARYPRSANVRRVSLVWVTRSSASSAWFGDTFDAAQAQAARPGWPVLDLRGFLTQPAAADDALPGVATVHGRPDMNAEVARVLEPLTDPQRVAVIACGPRGLVDAAWDACSAATRRGPHQMDFHLERIAL